MVLSRSLVSLVGLVFVAALVGGCGHSEDEWQSKLRELDEMGTRLGVEQARATKAQGELDEAEARIEHMKQQLKLAGVDVGNLNTTLEQQARATEEHRRRLERVEALKRRFEALRANLQGLTKVGLRVVVRNNRVMIQLPGDVLFDAGRETLRRDGKEVLVKVAEVIRNDPGLASRVFQVVGHTDNARSAGGPFKDNWGLSLMRAREVLAFLVLPADKGGGGLSPGRWSAAGYGDTDPVAENDTSEGKRANRRCELVLNTDDSLDLKALARQAP